MGKRGMTLQEVERFIGDRKGLRKYVREDFRHHRINREADLEACVLYHLRNFLRPDKNWQIFARAYAKKLGRFPDITILHGKVRRLAIELKRNKKEIPKKDRDTLNRFLGTQHARKAYFITTVRNKLDYRKLDSKTELERNRLKEIPIGLDLAPAPLKRFEGERESIKEALR
jgi:hypothetical protein